jgi:hypothetical protein
MDQQAFISALTAVFNHSHILSSLAIDNTPVDDMSLEVLASSNSQTLQLLQMKSCPRVSPEGKPPSTPMKMYDISTTHPFLHIQVHFPYTE